VKLWGRTHHRHITNLLITGNHIARWNIQRFAYVSVMINGVASFFFGLIFFIIDTQPVAVWITILLISVVSTGLIQTVKAVSSLGTLQFGSDSRSFFRRIFSPPDYLAEEKRSREVMARRQQAVAVMYKFCSDQGFV
jgi:hypothetical protein